LPTISLSEVFALEELKSQLFPALSHVDEGHPNDINLGCNYF